MARELFRSKSLRGHADSFWYRQHPTLIAVWADKAITNLISRFPDANQVATPASDALLRRDRFARVLASRADLSSRFLDGDEAFTAVNVRPDGVLNRGRDADPLIDL